MRNIKLLLQLFFLSLIIVLSFPKQIFAQAVGISVSPSVIRLDLKNNQSQTALTYTNTTNQTVEIDLSARDFTELEDGYKLSFLSQKDAQNYHYGLSSWIDFDKKTLILDPHESDTVTVYIDKQKLTPGGHYASILAQVQVKKPGSRNVQIQATLSSLLFVRTNTGREIEKAAVLRFSTIQDGFFFHIPQSAFFRLQNSGDTELIPYGTVEVTNMFGNIIQKGIVNEDSAIILPESIRRYNIKLRTLTTVFLPGFYKATLTLTPKDSPLHIIQTQTFFTEGGFPAIELFLVLCLMVGIYLKFLYRKKS